MTQKEVARILGLKHSATISRWEKGIVLPDTENALKLAALFRSSVDVIFGELRFSITEEILESESIVVSREGDSDA